MFKGTEQKNISKRNKERESMKDNYVILRPGGNDTALVIGLQRDPSKRKEINDKILSQNPKVEQVGFVNLDLKELELLMAGGEFCGNATRSTAWLALNGKPGEVEIKVSGVSNILRAGVKQNGDAWAQMPIYSEPSKIKKLEEGSYIVAMDGITQVVMPDPFTVINEEEIKAFTKKKLEELNLLESVPAAGIMFYTKVGQTIKIEPVVWVRDIQTLFYESACGSGTTAVGLVQALETGSSVTETILQPSGMSIDVRVNFNGEEFKYAEISGPIEILNEKESV